MPLLFPDQLALEGRDPQILANHLARYGPLLDFGPRPRYEADFLHRFVSAVAGDLTLKCRYTSSIPRAIGESTGTSLINLCCAGSSRYKLDGQDLHLTPANLCSSLPAWKIATASITTTVWPSM
jgi:hypothetical protein